MVRIDRTHSKDDSSGSKTTVNPVAGMPPLPSGPSIVHLPNGAEANEDYCSWTIYFGRNTCLSDTEKDCVWENLERRFSRD
jgi:hypothetical protein